MPTHDELVTLRERVRLAKGPDTALDREITSALLPGVVTHWEWTSSLDAAVALCERLLPDVGWSLIRFDNHAAGYQAEVGDGLEDGPTAALAFLSALLGALIAQQEVGDREPAA